jgi:L-ascorbate metabolism protein UlaG (beta-lactamase superfamily)
VVVIATDIGSSGATYLSPPLFRRPRSFCRRMVAMSRRTEDCGRLAGNASETAGSEAEKDAPEMPEPRRGVGRRRALKLLGGVGLAGLAGALVGLTPRRANAYYTGPLSDHFDGVRFYNPGGPGPKSLSQLLRWQFGSRAEPWPAVFPSPFDDKPPASVGSDAARLSFIGHASYLLQIAGRNLLMDPVYVDRASPVQFAGPKRVNPPGIAFDALPKIDTVLLTHNHYDHMDVATIARLWNRDRPRIITPLGNDAILKAEVNGLEVTAVDWGDRVDLGGLVVDAVPTQHWSARGTRDRMHALWASFVVQSLRHTIYLVGDTGFGDGGTFRHVAARHPRIDLAALPIGAYEPRWFMSDQHMNPAEAVEALELVRAARAVGHHWGTFKLTNEAIETPRLDLAAALAARNIASARFKALQPGEVVTL